MFGHISIFLIFFTRSECVFPDHHVTRFYDYWLNLTAVQPSSPGDYIRLVQMGEVFRVIEHTFLAPEKQGIFVDVEKSTSSFLRKLNHILGSSVHPDAQLPPWVMSPTAHGVLNLTDVVKFWLPAVVDLLFGLSGTNESALVLSLPPELHLAHLQMRDLPTNRLRLDTADCRHDSIGSVLAQRLVPGFIDRSVELTVIVEDLLRSISPRLHQGLTNTLISIGPRLPVEGHCISSGTVSENDHLLQLQFDPTLCWQRSGMKSYSFKIDLSAPFTITSVAPDHRYSVLSADSYSHILPLLHSTYSSIPLVSPDLFFLHPAVFNCEIMSTLFSTGILPKVMVLPFDPTAPPPLSITPDFVRSFDSVHFAQKRCSLGAWERTFRSLRNLHGKKYRLHRVLGQWAVFLRGDVWGLVSNPHLVPEHMDHVPTEYFVHWLVGSNCSPLPTVGHLRLDPRADVGKAVCQYLGDSGVLEYVREKEELCPENVTEKPTETTRCEAMRRGKRALGGSHPEHYSGFDDVDSCLKFCSNIRGCTFWTYDSSKLYGDSYCWTWIDSYPHEIIDEDGWFSGNFTCTLSKYKNLLSKEPFTLLTSDFNNPAHTLFHAGWSVLSLPELPGMKYEIESYGRGRCEFGSCECFPPFYGPLCEHTDLKEEVQARRKGHRSVIHFLTSNSEKDISDFENVLPRLWVSAFNLNVIF